MTQNLIDVPDPPERLLPEAKAFWRRNVPILFRSGLANVHDLATLSAMATCYAHWIILERKFGSSDEQYFIETHFCPFGKRNPLYDEMCRWERAFSIEAQRFGMTPLSRSRLVRRCK